MTDEKQPKAKRIDDLDLSGTRLHGPSFEGSTLTDAVFCDAEISGDIEGLRINGVVIAPLVEAELDRRFPERVRLRADDIEGLRGAWSMLENLWAGTTERAARLPEELQVQRVDGEWSFVETLRHLVFATDCWIRRGIRLDPYPYHPWGLPWTGADSTWARSLGVDTSVTPSLDEVLPVRRSRQEAVRSTLDELTDSVLADVRAAPDTEGYPIGEHSVLQCIHVILNEEWEHHRYSVRDLDVLDPSGADVRRDAG